MNKRKNMNHEDAQTANGNDSSGFNPWSYGIAGTLILFVLFLFSLIVFLSLQRRDLVINHYYTKGLNHDVQIAKIKNSRDLPMRVKIELHKQSKQLKIAFPVEFVHEELGGTIMLYRTS